MEKKPILKKILRSWRELVEGEPILGM